MNEDKLKIYCPPHIEVISINSIDIICTSAPQEGGNEGYLKDLSLTPIE